MATTKYIQGSPVLWRIQTDPTPSSAVVQAFFQTSFSNDADVTDTFTKSEGSVSWDAIKDASKTVVVGGKTYTYGEALNVVLAIANQEYNAQ